MTGHVFLSYSHAGDAAYVERLAGHLTQAGISVWFDRDIISGDRWHRVIREKIDTCGAFVVVMTPASEESDWVDLEINQAGHMRKPILPLLLAGDRFFRLSNVQYEDVKGGQMPSKAFLDRLREHQKPPAPISVPVATPVRAASAVDLAGMTRRQAEAKKLGDSGDHTGAARVLRDLVADRERFQGATHPETLTDRHNLALHTGEAGDRVEAARLFREVVADRIRVQGADNERTLSSRHNLAYNIGMGGQWPEAVHLFREVVADRNRALGPNHPDTLSSRHNLAHYLGETGDRAKAISLFKEVIAARLEVLGPDHPETLAARHALAYNIGTAGDRAEAVRMLRDVVADRTRVLGADYPNTKLSQEWLTYFGG